MVVLLCFLELRMNQKLALLLNIDAIVFISSSSFTERMRQIRLNDNGFS